MAVRITIQDDVYEYSGTLTVAEAMEAIQADFTINVGILLDDVGHELLSNNILSAGHGPLRYEETRDSGVSVGSVAVSVHDTVRGVAWLVIRCTTWLRQRYLAASANVKRIIDWLVFEGLLVFLCAILWFISAAFGLFDDAFTSALLNLVAAFVAVLGATDFWVVVFLFIKAATGPVRVVPAPAL